MRNYWPSDANQTKGDIYMAHGGRELTSSYSIPLFPCPPVKAPFIFFMPLFLPIAPTCSFRHQVWAWQGKDGQQDLVSSVGSPRWPLEPAVHTVLWGDYCSRRRLGLAKCQEQKIKLEEQNLGQINMLLNTKEPSCFNVFFKSPSLI